MTITLRRLLDEAMPYFAPLPKPIFQTVFTHFYESPQRYRSDKRRKHTIDLDTPLDTRIVEQFVARHQKSMYASYRYMEPYLLTGEYSSTWLASALSLSSPDKRLVPAQTMASYRKRNLLRDHLYDVPRIENAAALLSARMDDAHYVTHWLPSSIEKGEPDWWCWCQEAPEMPISQCPVPLPSNLPPHTLLWTAWPGASLRFAEHSSDVILSDWLQLDGYIGAIRFARVHQRANTKKTTWDISLDRLKSWDAQTTEANIAGIPFPYRKKALIQSIADLVLRRVGERKLGTSDLTTLFHEDVQKEVYCGNTNT